MKTHALILAGGVGKRVGGDTPKQFLPLGGKPMLLYSIEIFERCPWIDAITLVLPEDKIEFFKSKLAPSLPLSKLKKVVKGGMARQDSTRAGFESIDGFVDVVAVHDAARPLVTMATIQACVENASEFGAALSACPASDTIKETNGKGWVKKTIDRGKIFLAQTPQAFRYEILKEALDWASLHDFRGTDEASLVEQIGKPVKIVECDATNLKVTTPEDFAVAETLLQQRKK